MKAESLSGKNVRLILKNNFHYTGKIIEDLDISLKIIDKFGKEVIVSKDSIQVLEVITNDQ